MWLWDQVEPFGSNPANENPGGAGIFDMPLRFSGQYFDKETNVHYNYFRDYEPSTGRYLEADPVGITGLLAMEDFAAARLDRMTDMAIPSSGGMDSIFSWSSLALGARGTPSFAPNLHLYTYVSAGPLRQADPLGLAPAPENPEEALKRCLDRCNTRCDGELGRCAGISRPKRKLACMAGAYAGYFICIAKCTATHVPDLYDDD